MKISSSLILFSFLTFSIPTLLAQQCGSQAQGKTCSDGLCCSQWGWCGRSGEYCGSGCQSGPCDLSLMDISHIINKEAFERMILILQGDAMPNIGGLGLDTYEAFITAAKSFPSFGNVGNIQTRKTEIATFLARTLDGIVGNKNWMTKNDVINYFKTAIWFWMTPQSSKPSHHQLMIINGNSTSAASARSDTRRLPGYGVVTYIIKGGFDHDQSGKEYDTNVAERISLFMKYADVLGVDYEMIM